MKFLISVPTCLEACPSVRRLLKRALSSSPTSALTTSADAPPVDECEDSVFVCSDPPRRYLGSGGGTVHLLKQCFSAEQQQQARRSRAGGAGGGDDGCCEKEDVFWTWLARERRVLIHAGGQSRRLPSYAPFGKLLTPLPCLVSQRAQDKDRYTRELEGSSDSQMSIIPSSFLFPPSAPITAAQTSMALHTSAPRRLDETLLSQQVAFVQRALVSTPEHLRTVVMCGDVCLTAPTASLTSLAPSSVVNSSVKAETASAVDSTVTGERNVPQKEADEEVDVLCYGLSAEPRRLCAHGVFVVDTRRANALRSMLQKPSLEMLEEVTRGPARPHRRPHSSDGTRSPYKTLLDVGVWMLSDRAVRYLQEAAALKEQTCLAGSSDTSYDLFAEFGACLGEAPRAAHAAETPTPSAANRVHANVASLRVRIVDLTPTGTAFHHMGTTEDLLDATATWAEAVAPGQGPVFQPLYAADTTEAVSGALHHYVDVTRRIFVQHACVASATARALACPSPSATDTTCAARAECIWIENADVGAHITLHHHHVLTGFPRGNSWRLWLPPYTCVTICPVRGLAASHGVDEHTGSAPCYAARVYGYHDRWTGDVRDRTTLFLGRPLVDWLACRGLTLTDVLPVDAHDGLAESDLYDIQHARLFPCTTSMALLESLLQFVVESRHQANEAERKGEKWVALAARWRECPRVSAAELQQITNVATLASWRDDYLRVALQQWLAVESSPAPMPRLPAVYDQVDLHATAARWADLQLPLPLRAVPDVVSASVPAASTAEREEVAVASAPSMALYTARVCFFCAHVLRCRTRCHLTALGDAACVEAEKDKVRQWEQAGFASLQQCMATSMRPVLGCGGENFAQDQSTLSTPSSRAASWRLPRIAVHADQVVWASSPARIDLSGGWTDTPPFSLFYGGAVVNAAVEMNGQMPIQVYVRLRDAPEIAIRSVDLGLDQVVRTYEELREFAVVGSAFSIPKAALALAGFLPDLFPADWASSAEEKASPFTSLQDQLCRTFDGKGVELTVLVAIPAGSGMGTSSIVAGTALTALSAFCGLGWRTEDVCQRVLLLEQLLTTGGGWQDPFGGLYPGVKLVQSTPGTVQRPTVCWLSERLFTAPGLAGCHVLYYTGLTRVAKSILTEIVRGVFLNERARLVVLSEMREQVERLCTAISYGDVESIGRLLTSAWEQNKRLDAGTCPPAVQAIMDRIKPYTRGAKLLGAGGGGFLYILTTSEAATQRLKEELTANPPNSRARFVTMRLSNSGITVGRS